MNDLAAIAAQAKTDYEHHTAAMQAGFSVVTSHGEIVVSAEDARRNPVFINALTSLLQFRLFLAEQKARPGGAS